MHTRQSFIQNNKYQVSHKHSCFSWWWAQSRPKHVEKRNNHHHHFPPWITSFDLFRLPGIAVVSWGVRDHFYHELCSWRRVSGNKHTEKNFAPSSLYLQDYTRMHGQQNTKFRQRPFSPVIIIPQMLHLHTSVLYYRSYIISVNNSADIDYRTLLCLADCSGRKFPTFGRLITAASNPYCVTPNTTYSNKGYRYYLLSFGSKFHIA